MHKANFNCQEKKRARERAQGDILKYDSGMRHSFISMPAFLPGRVAGAAVSGGLEAPHGQQQFQVILMAPHQGGTKQGRRCCHSTWSLDDLWADFPWV